MIVRAPVVGVGLPHPALARGPTAGGAAASALASRASGAVGATSAGARASTAVAGGPPPVVGGGVRGSPVAGAEGAARPPGRATVAVQAQSSPRERARERIAMVTAPGSLTGPHRSAEAPIRSKPRAKPHDSTCGRPRRRRSPGLCLTGRCSPSPLLTSEGENTMKPIPCAVALAALLVPGLARAADAPATADVLGKLHHANQMEIQMGKLAEKNGQSKEVKDS